MVGDIRRVHVLLTEHGPLPPWGGVPHQIQQHYWQLAPRDSQEVAIGKRRRRETETGLDDGSLAAVGYYGTAPRKNVKGGASNGVLAAVQSRGRTTHNTAPRIPNQEYQKPKAQRCGVEEHATPGTQGMSNHSLLGQSFQQDWTADSL